MVERAGVGEGGAAVMGIDEFKRGSSLSRIGKEESNPEIEKDPRRSCCREMEDTRRLAVGRRAQGGVSAPP